MKVIFYKSLWFLFIFIISFMPIFGQTYVSTGSDVCLSTISRNPTGSYPVHYMKTGPYSGKMLFIFTIDNGMYFFKSLPINGYNVRDLTVVGNTVFFCGEDTSGLGFYGVWKKGTGIIPPHYFRIFKMYRTNTGLISDVQRIRVFCSGNDTNVLLIGKYNNEVSSMKIKSLIHIKNNNVCTVAYSEDEHFDDVEILDNYIVTVARKGNGTLAHEPHYMRVLNKNNLSLDDLLFKYYYAWDRRESISRILLQNTGGNRFVSVYRRDDYGYYFNTCMVDSYGVLQLYNYTKVAPSDYPIKVDDVSYNATDHNIAIAYNSDTVGYVSLFDCSLFPTASYAGSYKANFLSQNYKDTLASVARMSPAGFYVTGIRNNKMALWKMPGDCGPEVQCSSSITESEIMDFYWPTTLDTLDVHLNNFVLYAGNQEFLNLCVRGHVSPNTDKDKEE